MLLFQSSRTMHTRRMPGSRTESRRGIDWHETTRRAMQTRRTLYSVLFHREIRK